MKKAFLFSLFVITALALIVLTFKINVQFKEEDRAEVYKFRVEAANDFIDDMTTDVERSLYVSAFRGFLGADEYIHKNLTYMDNATLRLGEMILNGTYNGTQLNVTYKTSFNDWLHKIKGLAREVNLIMVYNKTEITVRQETPWIIRINVTANISFYDVSHVVEWNMTIVESTVIDISDAKFPDPLYFVESIRNNPEGSALKNTIRRTPYAFWWENKSGAIITNNLTNHTIGQYYINSSYGPSYLMRLEGRTDCSGDYFEICKKYGIESIVDIYNLSSDDIWTYSGTDPDATCAVDYQFFREGCDTWVPFDTPPERNMVKVVNMSPNFLMDWKHMELYNLTAINAS